MRKSKLLAISILTLVGSLGLTLPVHSQCATINTAVIIPGVFIVKLIGPASVCTLTKFNSAGVACFPGGIGATQTATAGMVAVTAQNLGGGMDSPSCGWNCKNAGVDCGNVVINSLDDGLPVELMEFSVE